MKYLQACLLFFPAQPQLRAAFERDFCWGGRFPSRGLKEWVGLFSAMEQRRRRLLAMGQWAKRKIWGRKDTQIGGLGFWISILSSFVNLFPTNLGSGSSQFSGFLRSIFVNLKGIEQGFISPGPFSCHPRGMRAKCQDMQMRLWGNNRQEWMMAASPPIPRRTIKYSNGILLEGRGRRKFPDAGQKMGVAGSTRKGGGS